MESLDDALDRIAASPVLLVASDYDGTISPIVTDPKLAHPQREAIVALRMLTAMPHTHVALISGRALGELSRISGAPEGTHLVGSHGSEFDPDFASSLSPAENQLRKAIETALAKIARSGEGTFIEQKPASVALHYRSATREVAKRVRQAVLDGPAALDGVFLKEGKEVMELTVVSTSKGDALDRIRTRVGASAVVFFGDDITDEDAFGRLVGPDVGVKVGDGSTVAHFRVHDPNEVAQRLAALCERRASWLAGDSVVPIEQHSLLSDQRTAALVTPSGRVTWFCVPRLDSSALFAELLGGASAGYFAVAAADGSTASGQRYQEGSMSLITQFANFSVTDFLDCSAGRPRQRAGRTDLLRVIEGTGEAIIDFAPRLDFGRTPTTMAARPEGLMIEGTNDPVVLLSPGVDWEIYDVGQHQSARATVSLSDSPVVLELRYGTGSMRGGSADALDRLQLTNLYWSAWSDRLKIPSVASDLIRRSALTLRSLCHGPTGAIAAAATTSLPEHLGGVRNWDYRYCWPRDAAMAASALVALGSTDEAMQFLDWLLGVVDGCQSPEQLSPIYSLVGTDLGPEADISELSGYAGSRPVRVGNLAARQVQLDVFGPVVDLVHRLSEADAPLSSDHFRLVEQMVLAVEKRWQEPDHGIWEIRGPRRHHVHSKVMGWLTVDRGVQIAERILGRRRPEWVRLRDAIAEDVLTHGYNEDLRAFTAAYGEPDLDAASLWVGLSGLLPPDDPRFEGTIEAVEKQLSAAPAVYRYRLDDGLPGREGGFLICGSWLVDAYLNVGRVDDAERWFATLTELAGATGMLAEQFDPDSGLALGNMPQAYSHIGVVMNAIRLAAAKGMQ